MKVNTNLKVGNALNDIASLGCQSAKASANFLNRADQEARNLAGNLNYAAQSTWNSLVGWVKPS